MKFSAHKPRRRVGEYPRAPANSVTGETIILAGVSAAVVMLLTVAAVDELQSYRNPPQPPQAIQAPAAYDLPDPFEDLPTTPEQIEASKREAEAKFAAAWEPKTRATTRGGWSLELSDCGDECQRTNRQKMRWQLNRRDERGHGGHSSRHSSREHGDGGRHTRRDH